MLVQFPVLKTFKNLLSALSCRLKPDHFDHYIWNLGQPELPSLLPHLLSLLIMSEYSQRFLMETFNRILGVLSRNEVDIFSHTWENILR